MELINDYFLEIDVISGEPSVEEKVTTKVLFPMSYDIVVHERGLNFSLIETSYGSYYVRGSYMEVRENICNLIEEFRTINKINGYD